MTLLRHSAETSPCDLPLLSQAEIIELRHRAQRLRATTSAREVAHRLPGENPSAFRGVGPDVEESRLYQPGDELRHMNWRLSARTTGHYIKIFREERRPGTFLLLDRRATMRFGTRKRLKVTQAVRAAALLAFAARANNFGVGAVILDRSTSGNKPVWIREQHDDAGIQHLIDTANGPCPPASASAQHAQQPALPDTLKLLQTMLTRGSDVILISDFIDLESNCRTVLAQLAAEHNLRAIHIIDPAEPELPRAGKLRLQAGNGQPSFTLNTSNPVIAAEYAAAAKKHISARQQLFAGLNIPCSQLLADTDNIEHLLRTVT